MKAILFYNKYSTPDLTLKAQIEAEGLHIESVEIMTEDNPFKKYIRATPALITITDDTQGEFLQDPEVDMITYLRALLIQSQDKEELTVHKQDNMRLDKHIKMKQEQAADAVTEDLLERGVL